VACVARRAARGGHPDSRAVSPPPTVDELVVADDAGSWREAGFRVDGNQVAAGSVRIRLAGRGEHRGIRSWSLRDTGTLELDGLATSASERAPTTGAAHPNGVLSVDHLVVMTPDLDRTVGVLEAAGFDLRRRREDPTPGGSQRQAFFRMAELILELVEAPAGTRVAADPDGPARLWGIAFLVEDLEATARALGPLVGSPRDAVQPGRLIATLRREAGLGPAIAFMSPGAGGA
jgi:hypothetical protein